MSSLKLTDATPIVSMKRIMLSRPERGLDLSIKVSAPSIGDNLPVIIFAHGFGSSQDAHEPLADFWASHGFVVIQPTFLDSRKIQLEADDPRIESLWRIRVDDMKCILDNLNEIESIVPGLEGRLNHDQIVTAGHSFGGQTAGNLLGLQVMDPVTYESEDLSDSRVKGGVLLATAGEGGDKLSQFAVDNFTFLNPTFEHMTNPTLIVAGDQDHSPLTVNGPEWMTEPYYKSPGNKSLLNLFGAEHSLGGIPGYDAKETTDDNPSRVQLIQHATWAYFRYVLDIEADSWLAISNEYKDNQELGIIISKKKHKLSD
ncbi:MULTISPECIES: chlorophyllase [unclassified Mammaliicoccus]|uniref:alpha/beta hydrolase family protein n=1 Tax=Mammaliicoccus TaxID=2803850 RepID=UPI001EFB5AFC|nr:MULTISPECIES: chlorophyllase [unclassified Mammaliicoccus]